jgi:hypothetical protein
MLAQRHKTTEMDPVASQRTLVHKWNIDPLSQDAVASYVDLLLYLRTLFEKQDNRSSLYKYALVHTEQPAKLVWRTDAR